MELKTENNPMIRHFLGKAKNMDGKEFTVKLMVFEKPIAETVAHGPIYTGKFIDNSDGENVFSMLFGSQFTDKEMQLESQDMIDNIDKYLEGRIIKKK